MSTLETNSIAKYSGNNVSIDDSLNLKSYTTTQRDALTSAAGDIIYNSTTNKVQFFNGSAWADTAIADQRSLIVNFLVVSGGGNGGSPWYGGGGGGGGFITSFVRSGANSFPVDAHTLSASTNYAVTVGGGASASSFVGTSTISPTKGGNGANENSSGSSGGSGGGGGGSDTGNRGSGGSGTGNQGNSGGLGSNGGFNSSAGGGGGGAGGNGSNGSGSSGGSGGSGLASTITGSSVTYAQGGAGNNPTAGTVNRGNGGGGRTGGSGSGGSGGSGIIILRYPNNWTITVGAGLTYTDSEEKAVGNQEKYVEFTQGTGNVSWTQD